MIDVGVDVPPLVIAAPFASFFTLPLGVCPLETVVAAVCCGAAHNAAASMPPVGVNGFVANGFVPATAAIAAVG